MDASNAQTQSLFRTHSWVQSWIDVWGHSSALTLIDVGGRKDPLEHLYLTTAKIKGILPVRTLCLAGTGFGPISTPRSEYNDMAVLTRKAGNIPSLLNEIKQINWQQWFIPDIVAGGSCEQQVHQIATAGRWPIHQERDELAYAVSSTSFPDYKNNLSANTRRTYFNQRSRLRQQGTVEREVWPIDKLHAFVDQLNHFHDHRWGKPCFSRDSTHFFDIFLRRLHDERGTPVLDVMTLDGKPISVLLDIIWRGTRHNLQSGFSYPAPGNLSLGALHMGFAIEDAIRQRQSYDFLAGHGKNSNYKVKLANTATRLTTVIIQKRALAALRKIHSLSPFGH